MSVSVTPLPVFGVMLSPAETGCAAIGSVIDTLREVMAKEHLIVLRGFQGVETADALCAFCERLGVISVWPFGKVLELVEQAQPEDHVFDHSHIPLHWDGMYRPQVPAWQVFHCVNAPLADQGGRTTFSNTRRVCERLTPAELAAWQEVTGVYQRKMAFYDSKTVAPIVTAHPVSGFPVIRYCEAPQASDQDFKNHPDIAWQGVAEAELAVFHERVRAALYAPEVFYAHAWQTGDLVLADNHTLLHGREAFVSGAPRHLRRVHVLGTPPLENPHLVYHR